MIRNRDLSFLPVYFKPISDMRISVCMATYNGGKYIRQQLESILSQLSADDEVIVSDDGSRDGTLPVIDSFSDSRIKVFRHGEPHGVIHNFENALMHAEGDYIFLCDQDDIWEMNKVESCLSSLQDNLLVLHDASLIDKSGYKFRESYFALRHSKTGYLNNLWRNSYIGCCMAFRRELLKYLFPFPRHIEMHDRWIGLQAELHGKTALIHEPLSRYRIHGQNASNSAEKSRNSLFRMVCIRYWMAYYTLRYRLFH